MSAVPCFLLDPTDRVTLRLRRYATGECVGAGTYHNASVPFQVVPAAFNEDNYLVSYDHLTPPRDDTRWPKTCAACSYEFQPEDNWQIFQELVYVRSDTGAEVTLRDAPVGGMWDAFWHPWKGPDGKSYMIMTPGGEWVIDGPSSFGGHWTRTGTAPRITVRPSIHFPGRYHGWLTDGVLTEC